MAIHHISHHTGSAAVADDMNDHLLVLEHPVPVGAAIDAHRRFVGADDARTAQSGQNRRDLVVEAGFGTTEQASNAPSLICKAIKCWISRLNR